MNLKKRMTNKGLSPIIATILLIAMVVVIGVLIFLWFKGMQKEALTKFEGRNIEQVCGEVNFDVDYVEGKLSILNKGNVPISDFNIQAISEDGAYETSVLGESLGTGGSISKDISFSDSNKLTISPILAGNTEQGDIKGYSCDADKYGKTLNI